MRCGDVLRGAPRSHDLTVLDDGLRVAAHVADRPVAVHDPVLDDGGLTGRERALEGGTREVPVVAVDEARHRAERMSRLVLGRGCRTSAGARAETTSSPVRRSSRQVPSSREPLGRLELAQGHLQVRERGLEVAPRRLEAGDVTRGDQHAVLELARLDRVEAGDGPAVDDVLVGHDLDDERLTGLDDLPVARDQLTAREHRVELGDPAPDELVPGAAGDIDRRVVHPLDDEVDDPAVVVAHGAFDDHEVEDAVERPAEPFVERVGRKFAVVAHRRLSLGRRVRPAYGLADRPRSGAVTSAPRRR